MNLHNPVPTQGNVTTQDLRRALKLVAATATNKSPIESHHCIDIAKDGCELVFTATDGAVWTRCAVRHTGTGAAQGSLVPLPLMRSLPKSGNVEVAVSDGLLQVGGSKFSMEPAGGLTPEVVAAPITTLLSINREALCRVAPAMSKDETRSNLNGILVESVNDSMRLIATDGFRLTVLDVPTPFSGPSLRLPRRAVELVLKTGSPVVHVAVAGSWVHLEMHEYGSIRCQLTDPEFPDYRMVIPKEIPGNLKVDRHQLIDVVSRLRNAGSTRGCHAAAKVTFVEGEAAIEVSGGDGSATLTDTLLLAGLPAGRHLVPEGFALNAGYLLDGLKVLESKVVEIGFSSSSAPFTIRGTGTRDETHTYILMPIRL